MKSERRRFAIDFHVHTAHSFDSLTPPKLVIETARRRGLDGVAITDHDTVRGALETMEMNKHNDFTVIPGVEVTSDRGDVIGLYVTEDIESRKFSDVVEEIHAKGGLVYLPHPIRTFGRDFSTVHAENIPIDVWERYNGRYSESQFRRSDQAFDALAIGAALCGSDAHLPWEIGLLRTLLDDLPTDARSLLTLARSARLEARARAEIPLRAGIALGEATKKLKRREYVSLALLLAALPWKAARRLSAQRRATLSDRESSAASKAPTDSAAGVPDEPGRLPR
ncbi:MAG: PHP domain-containing protein [Candidatus Eremiobacteraeota bacterium]|nr:PHP domain-containing protein [Candidatus Eremiobacteraeota bacterium]